MHYKRENSDRGRENRLPEGERIVTQTEDKDSGKDNKDRERENKDRERIE